MSKKTGTKKKQTKQKEKQQGFNDLLIPMLLILCIMPFIVRLALYSCGYAKYPWYSDENVIMDLYSYYRCYFFEVVAIFTAAVLAFRIGLFPENRKKNENIYPVGSVCGNDTAFDPVIRKYGSVIYRKFLSVPGRTGSVGISGILSVCLSGNGAGKRL